MAIEVVTGSPLAAALNTAILPKLVETGWAAGGGDDAALSEYIILMLVNGNSEEQIATELSGEVLGLGPDDPSARDFARWLFEQVEQCNNQINGVAPAAQAAPSGDDSAAMEQDIDMNQQAPAELNAPTGPKSMRNGGGPMRGNREKRMFGQMNKAMDRTHEGALHRVRNNGNERINSHNRGPPAGPRGGAGRGNHRMNNRAAGIAAGLGNMAGMPQMPGGPGMNGMGGDPSMMMMGGGGGENQIFNLLQQQSQMMAALQQQLAQQNQGNNGRPGRSLFERTQRGGHNNNFRRGGNHGNGPRQHHNNHNGQSKEGGAEGDDVDMGQTSREPPNPDTSVCKYNQSCSNPECKFAHASPAAPRNVTIDLNDSCSFGAACKNFKCVGRHPSPATKRAHQGEMECKFYPNCTNPRCPFKHPDMPPCRNGGDCSVEGCKFTHVKTMCKYNPCTNRFCPFKHEDGQRGTFPDKVWTADGSKNHVSDRKFVDGESAEEVVLPGAEEQDTGAMDEGIA